MGIGGTPEGVISAAAVKSLGGALQGRLWPRDDAEREQLVGAGYDPEKVLTTDDLVAGDDLFVAATGVTSGALLRRRPLHARRRDHALARHALPLGHVPPHRGDARVREAGPLRGHHAPVAGITPSA